MKIGTVTKLWLQKGGNKDNEYEDAMRARVEENDETGKPQCYRFAVADGATESIFSGLWADILVDAFTSGDLDLSKDSLKPIRARWNKKMQKHMPPEAIPWYLEEKLREGSYAALASLILYPNDGYAKLTAIGDSCIFRIRDKEIESFPLRNSWNFNSHPQLLGTVDSDPSGFLKEEKWDLCANDIFLFMTDALAAWFMRKQESDAEDRWQLLGIKDDSKEEKSRFVEIIKSARGSGELKNDDVTLMIVRVVDD